METEKKLGFSTRQIHVGKRKNSAGALCDPIYQTSTFMFETVEQGGARFAGTETGYVYSRPANPSTNAVEEKIASLENGEAAMATASGMGAVGSVMIAFLKCGDHVIFDNSVYGGTNAVATVNLPNMGIEVSRVDTSDLEALKAAIKPNTKMIYFETPNNPMIKVTDVAAVKAVAGKDIRVVVDATFAPPPIQHVLKLGADVVLHSITKYINGHGDVIAGFVISDAEFIGKCRMFGLKDMTGAVMSPFNAFLIARGLKTLDIRMERHSANAMKVAEFLHDHPAIDKVYYPGLEDFEGHEIAKKQMKLYGGMMSIELKADRDAVANALNKLQLCTIAVSLGDAETLVEHAASMTHSTYTPEELKASGISEGLVRISVGLEDPEDIIADLKSVLDTLV